MAVEHVIYIDEDGTVEGIYDDATVGIVKAIAAHVDVRRASHVEPYADGWIADMRPVGGPVLFADGETPDLSDRSDAYDVTAFATRQAALDAERRWLDARMRTGSVL